MVESGCGTQISTGRMLALRVPIMPSSPARIFRVIFVLFVTWAVSVALSADAGPISAACLGLELTLSGSGDDTLLSWNEPPGAESYCVEMGDLGSLVATEGDFRFSIVQELASHGKTTSLRFSGTPARGEGYWFLVKDNPAGTFDTGCASQVASRDEEILSAGDVCVN